MAAYYNEIDPYAAQWLRNLIAAGHIAPGDVDERSINDVKADDLKNYTQCHFFAGIGVWSYALRLAGWPDDRPVWTGSCPCQPFSAAGKQQGTADDRHLWPVWSELIRQRKPAVVFGEQVEAAIRHGWLDLVQADLEGIDYAFAAAGIPAAGFGAPHIRQRLWFVAESNQLQSEQFARSGARPGVAEGAGSCGEPARSGTPRRLGNNNNNNKGLEGHCGGHQAEGGWDGAVRSAAAAGESGGVADSESDGRGVLDTTNVGSSDAPSNASANADDGATVRQERPPGQRAGPTNGHWRNADWLHCRDGKWRPVEPGTFPLAHGAASRVGRLRAYGNAIVPQVAAEVISAYMLG
jgi:DNA (cytosine-5)-methyltransferase 1